MAFVFVVPHPNIPEFVGMGYPVSRHWEDLREKPVPGCTRFSCLEGRSRR
jgi:hypothetical protein